MPAPRARSRLQGQWDLLLLQRAERAPPTWWGAANTPSQSGRRGSCRREGTSRPADSAGKRRAVGRLGAGATSWTGVWAAASSGSTPSSLPSRPRLCSCRRGGPSWLPSPRHVHKGSGSSHGCTSWGRGSPAAAAQRQAVAVLQGGAPRRPGGSGWGAAAAYIAPPNPSTAIPSAT